mmetsp:Transcript_28903/g.42845  ORF Transcript_28903/g.42845 Transcript_28903/m.42845 type:complete len:273 (-) Transcript_28903:444-1262(-)
MYATMMVVSSTTPSSFIHRFLDSAARKLHTAFASFAHSAAYASRKHSSFSMNSHSPSEAIMRHSCSDVIVAVVISGVDMMPASWPTVSPKERDMARPGTSMFPSHTRGGPSMPSSYLMANTRPPLASIRAFSAGKSGLWSWDTSSGITAPVLSPAGRRPKMIRESPMFAQVSLFPTTVASTQVLPLKRALIRLSASISFSIATTQAVMASPLCAGNFGWENSISGKRSRKYCDTWWPNSPWPSSTPTNSAPVLGSSVKIIESWFFFAGLYGA